MYAQLMRHVGQHERRTALLECVCVLSVIPTLGSNISSWLSGLCLPAPTLRIRSVLAINFFPYLNLFQATLSLSAQLVALQAAVA